MLPSKFSFISSFKYVYFCSVLFSSNFYRISVWISSLILKLVTNVLLKFPGNFVTIMTDFSFNFFGAKVICADQMLSLILDFCCFLGLFRKV